MHLDMPLRCTVQVICTEYTVNSCTNLAVCLGNTFIQVYGNITINNCLHGCNSVIACARCQTAQSTTKYIANLTALKVNGGREPGVFGL